MIIVIIGFSVSVGFRTAEVLVFWDMVGCPIPSGMDVVTVSENIRLAVKKAGYRGHVEINAFGDSSQSIGDLSQANVTMNVLTEGAEQSLSLFYLYMYFDLIYIFAFRRQRRESSDDFIALPLQGS